MFVVETDTTSKLLVLSVAGVVTADESRETVSRVREKLAEMAPGFVVLVDFRWLESMATGSVPFVAEIMDALAGKGVSAVVRVMPSLSADSLAPFAIATKNGFVEVFVIRVTETAPAAADPAGAEPAAPPEPAGVDAAGLLHAANRTAAVATTTARPRNRLPRIDGFTWLLLRRVAAMRPGVAS